MKNTIYFRCMLVLSCTIMMVFFTTSLVAQPTSCANCPGATNLVTDGDFSAGTNTLAAGLSTSLDPICDCNDSSGNPAYGSYCIDLEADDKCFLFDNVQDHTNPGVSGFMIVDGFGSTPPPQDHIIWKEAVNVPAAGTYDFSFWYYPDVSSQNTSPRFNFRVDYNPIVTNIGVGASLNSWNEFCTSYNFPAAGTYVIEIAQAAPYAGGGYDFGIDDIYLGESCCDCDIDVTISAVQTGPMTYTFTANLTTSSCTSPVSIDWNFGDGNFGSGATVTHTYGSPGWYGVSVSVLGMGNGTECEDFDKTKVFVEEQKECLIDADFTYTATLGQIMAFNTSIDPITIDRWDWEITDGSGPTWFGANVPSGTDASTHPLWDFAYIPNMAGPHTLCLYVYDDDIPDCSDQICFDFKLTQEPPTDCDLVAAFDCNQLSGSTYHFDNLSTASSSMFFNWTIRDLSSGLFIYTQASPPGSPDVIYTLPGQGSYEICLNAQQPAASINEECFQKVCKVIEVGDVEDYLNFTMGYTCDNDQAELFINSLNTNATTVDITTSCSSPATGLNFTAEPIPLSPMPFLIATEPPLTFSTCTVTVTGSNGVFVTQTIYFNCQACPGSGGKRKADGLQQEAVNRLEVFPNPSQSGEVFLSLTEMTGPLTIELINQGGQVLRTVNIDLSVSNLRMPFNTTGIAPGLYFLRVNDGDSQQIQKLVIQ